MKGFVYILRYDDWKIGVWKIGSTKDIDTRLKSYVTSNGFLPDNVLIKYCDEFRNEEKQYHYKFKLNKCEGQREHFILQNLDIEKCFFDNFKQYIGEVHISSVEEDLELLHYKLKEDIQLLKNEYENNFQELEKNTNEKICQLKLNYEKSIQLILKKTELETTNIAEKQTEKQQTEKQQSKENRLYNFLKLHSVYKKNNVITMEELRENFSNWLGKNTYKLDIGTIKQVNSDYDIIKIHHCKHCNKRHKKGCCENYTSKDRTTKNVVFNISFVTYQSKKS